MSVGNRKRKEISNVKVPCFLDPSINAIQLPQADPLEGFVI